MNVVLLGVLAYVLLQLVFGFWVSRRVKTESDYLLAGRKLGYSLAIFSIFGTWFGAETCIGTAGVAYDEGLAGVTADPFGYSLCLILMGLLLAVPFWKRGITTIADLVRQRFSIRAERLAALIIAPASIIWAGAQIRAFGQVLSSVSDLTLTAAILVATTVVIVYTVSGGLLADAMTDFLQGGVLIIGLIVLAIVIVADVGGVSSLLAVIEPTQLDWVSRETWQSDWAALGIIESWAVPICGSLVAQELVSRVVASRSPQVAKRSSLVAGGMYLFVGLIPLTLGLAGPALVPGLEHSEQILPRLAGEHLPTILYIVFAGALVSAILSTVDSALLAATALISHNVIIPFRPRMSEASKVRIERWGVAVFGVCALLLALGSEGIYSLVEEASAFGSSGVLVVILFALFTKWGREGSAIATLVTGIASYGLAEYIFHLPYSYTFSLAASVVVYLFFAWVQRAQPMPVAAME